MGDLNLRIEIPSDSDGFILLQCPLCNVFFKLSHTDIEADDILDIWCPSCGLKSENYLTDEVFNLAQAIVKNKVQDMLHQHMKEWERKSRGKGFSFKAGPKPNDEYESPIIPGIDELEIQTYECCKRDAKISPSVKLEGSYCPFCGVNYDEYK